MTVVFVWAVRFNVRLSKLMEKIEETIEIARTTAGVARGFVERTIGSLETFKNSIFTFETALKIIMKTMLFIKNNSPTGEKRS